MASIVRARARIFVSQRRHFVSTVLLSTRYEEKTVAELKQEAKSRGLAVSGSKATLITRILQSDKQLVDSLSAEPTPVQQAQARSIHSTPPPKATEANSSTASSTHFPTLLLAKLPDLSKEAPEPPIQVPFLPDQWDSSKIKEREGPKPVEPDTPRILVTAGAETHPAGGPTFNLVEVSGIGHSPFYLDAPSTVAVDGSSRDGIVYDMLEDLGLPSSSKLRDEAQAVARAAADYTITPEFSPSEKSHSRPLDRTEKSGIWLLVGILGGSWIVGGLANPSRKKTDTQKH